MDRQISANLVLKLQQWAQAWQQASTAGQSALTQLKGGTGSFATTSTGHFNQAGNAVSNFGSKVANGCVSTIKSMATMTASFVTAQGVVMGLAAGFHQFVLGSIEFQSSLSTTLGLTSVTEEQMGSVQKRLLEIAPSLGKSPNELAEAFYFAASAIDDTDKAMAALEVSAKASAAGLGDTKTVVDAVTSAMNAYNLGAEDAQRITDILLSTVKYGKMEPADLAGSLGRVLPIAAQLGVPLEEIGANLAVMTNTGLSCDEAVTGVRAVLASLLKPSQGANEQFAALGLSAAGLRQQLKEKGLLSVLNTLISSTKGNDEALAEIIPNIRALTDVLGSAGVQGENYERILNGITNDLDSTNKAFEHHKKTFEYVAGRFKATIQAAFYNFALKVLPVVTAGLLKFADFTQAAMDKVGGVLGNLSKYLQAVVQDGDLLNDWLDKLPPPLQLVAVVIGQVIQNIIKIADVLGDWREKLSGTGDGLGKFMKPLGDVFKALALLEEKFPIVSTLITAFILVLAIEAVAAFATALGGIALSFVTFPFTMLGTATTMIGDFVKSTAGLVSKTVTITQNVVQSGAELIRSLPWVYSEIKQNIIHTGDKLITGLKDITQNITQKVWVKTEEGPMKQQFKNIALRMAASFMSGLAGGIAALAASGLSLAALAPIGAALVAAAPIIAIVVAIALVAMLVGYLIYRFRDQIWEFLQSIPDALMGLLGRLKGLLVDYWPLLVGVLIPVTLPAMLIVQFREQIWAFLSAIPGLLGELLGGIGDWLSNPENVGRFFGRAVGVLIIAMFPIPALIIKFREQIAGFFEAVGGVLAGFFTSLPGLIGDHSQEILLALFPIPALIIKFHEQIAGFFAAIPGVIVNLITGLPGFIGDHSQEILWALFPIPMLINRFREQIAGFFAAIPGVTVEFFASLPGLIGDHSQEILLAMFPIPMLIVQFHGQITAFFDDVTATVIGWIGDLGATFTGFFNPWNWVQAAWEAFKKGIMDILGWLWGSGFITDWLTGLANFFIGFFQPWNWIAGAMTAFVFGLVSNFAQGVQVVAGFVMNAASTLAGLIPWEWVAGAMANFVWNIAVSIANAVSAFIGMAVDVFNALGEVERTIISSVAGWAGNALSAALLVGQNIVTGIKNGIGDAGNLLWGIGADIVGGLANGMKSALGKVGDVAGGIGGFIKGLKGPREKDLALLRPEGGYIMQGLAAGLLAGLPVVAAALRDVNMAFSLPSSFRNFAIPAKAFATAGTAAGARAGTQYHRTGSVYYGPVHIHVSGDSREVMRQLDALLR